MKMSKRKQKLVGRQQDYEQMMKNPAGPDKLKPGYHKPGSLKK
jgi:hypothetical protein